MKKNLKSKIALFASVLSCVCTMQGAFANPLHDAVNNNSIPEVAKQLTEHPDWADVANEAGYTPLMLAARRGNKTIAEILLDGYGDRINISAVTPLGMSPIHFAVISGNLEMVDLLLKRGVNINMQDVSGNTPLHHAVFRANDWHHLIKEDMSNNQDSADLWNNYNKSKDIIKFLIDKNANPNIQNNRGMTPANVAEFMICGLNFWSSIGQFFGITK